MKDRLTRNIFSAAGQTIVQTLLLLILYRYLLDQVGVAQLGVWSVMMAAVSAARVSELGLTASIIKFVAAYRANGNDLAAAESLQTAAIGVGALLAIVLAIAYPFLLSALPHVLPTEGLDVGQTILPYSLVSLFLTSVAGIWMNALDACLHSGLRAGIMIFSSFVFFLIALIGVGYYGLVGLAVAQVAQGVILVTAGWVVIRRVMHGLPLLPQQWNTARFREMLGYGISFQINSIVILLYEPITKILVGRYGGLSAAGYFEMAHQMAAKIRALVVETNRVIVPVYAGMCSNKINVSSLYTRNIRNLLFFAIPIFATLIALTPAISEVWVGIFQPQFVIMGAWITFAWFVNTVSTPAYFAYLGQGKLFWITVAHVVTGVTNILAGLLLGRLFGWQGVLISFVGALVLGSLITVCAYQYEHRIEDIQFLSAPNMMSAGACFGAAVIALIGYWAAIDASLADRWVRVTIATIFTGIVSISAIWFHPLRSQILTMVTSRSRNFQG